MAIPSERHSGETSVIGAVVDVVDAGQRVLLDRIELLSLEARAAGSGVVASLAFLLCGLGLLMVGWVAANALAILLIARVWSPAEGFAIVAGVNLAAGLTALLLARRRSTSVLPTRTNDHDAAQASNGGATA